MKQWTYRDVTYLTDGDVSAIMPHGRRMSVFFSDAKCMLPEWMRSLV